MITVGHLHGIFWPKQSLAGQSPLAAVPGQQRPLWSIPGNSACTPQCLLGLVGQGSSLKSPALSLAQDPKLEPNLLHSHQHIHPPESAYHPAVSHGGDGQPTPLREDLDSQEDSSYPIEKYDLRLKHLPLVCSTSLWVFPKHNQ